ncbi:hypothetical protein SO802_015905 [Lithocarpus litseifolius]|uniref:Uncharacterized protein n=1 Tax=Lithocarpus litseifolius TaxID=425828 RepID=A0AAW2CXE7_9ROSI
MAVKETAEEKVVMMEVEKMVMMEVIFCMEVESRMEDTIISTTKPITVINTTTPFTTTPLTTTPLTTTPLTTTPFTTTPLTTIYSHHHH